MTPIEFIWALALWPVVEAVGAAVIVVVVSGTVVWIWAKISKEETP